VNLVDRFQAAPVGTSHGGSARPPTARRWPGAAAFDRCLSLLIGYLYGASLHSDAG